MAKNRGPILKQMDFESPWAMRVDDADLPLRSCSPNAEIIRQKQPFRRWLRQRKIFLVEYLSTLPAKIFIFLASAEKSYFLGFFRHQHPSSALLQTELRNIHQPP